jgi:hypothetical protein
VLVVYLVLGVEDSTLASPQSRRVVVLCARVADEGYWLRGAGMDFQDGIQAHSIASRKRRSALT